jgi:hypothetical protein
MDRDKIKLTPHTWAVIASVVIALMAGIWSFSRHSISRNEVRDMIKEYSAPKTDLARVGESLKGLSIQVGDLKKAQERRFDRIDQRLDRIERKK